MKLWWRFWKWFDSLYLGSSGIGVVDDSRTNGDFTFAARPASDVEHWRARGVAVPKPPRKIGEL